MRVTVKLAKALAETFSGLFKGWTCAREHNIAFLAAVISYIICM
jgi:hypothetical protein